MSEAQGFDALASLSSNPEAAAPAEPKIDAQGRAYATGKRKNAIARVWIKPGKGKITINGRDQEVYFARPVLRMMIAQPLEVTDRLGQFDVVVTVEGSGLSGQAGAVRHGLSKALTYYEPGLRTLLKPHGFLTRDSRVVERKKYGKAKARRSLPVLEALSVSISKKEAAVSAASFLPGIPDLPVPCAPDRWAVTFAGALPSPNGYRGRHGSQSGRSGVDPAAGAKRVMLEQARDTLETIVLGAVARRLRLRPGLHPQLVQPLLPVAGPQALLFAVSADHHACART